MRKFIYERIYDKLNKLGVIALIENNSEAAKSVVDPSGGFMDLCFDKLDDDRDKVRISLAHYYKQNGDLMCDPDMEILVYHGLNSAEALTFQMANPPIYQEVYPEPGKVNPKLKRQLNSFLNTWLKNAIDQGHHFTA